MVGAIAFLSPYTHTHVDTNIPVSRVWRMGMPQMSGVPGWVWALLIPAVWLGGEPLGLLVLFSSVVNWGMVIPCLPYIAILFLTKIEMRKCLCNCLLNSSFCILQRDILVAKVHLIPLTFIEHLLRSRPVQLVNVRGGTILCWNGLVMNVSFSSNQWSSGWQCWLLLIILIWLIHSSC